MDKKTKKIIEIIIDRLKDLDLIVEQTYKYWGVCPTGRGGIDEVFSIGYKGIPMILGEKESDYLDDLFFDYHTGKITKKQYFKELEKYLKEEE